MKNKVKLLAVVLSVLLALTACNTPGGTSTDTQGGSDISSPVLTDEDISARDGEMFTARDYEIGYDETAAVKVELKGDSATSSSDMVRINGSVVTLTKEATYIFSGTLTNGKIIVNAADTDKLQIVLNGVSLTHGTSAAIYVVKADKVFITLASGTENVIANGGSFVAIDTTNIDGAIFSKQDITFNGSGSLTVNSPAGHGIVCKDDVVFTSGTYTVNAANHAIQANDSVRIKNATLTLKAGKDGIRTENDTVDKGFVYASSGNVDITAESDGIRATSYMEFLGGSFKLHVKADGLNSRNNILVRAGSFDVACGDDAFHADGKLTVNGGDVNVTASVEGLEGGDIEINGGTVKLKASDDGINTVGGTDVATTTSSADGFANNAKGNVVINGGTVELVAEGDGIDCGGSFEMNGGTVTVSVPMKDKTVVLDYEGTGIINGGTFVGIGASKKNKVLTSSGAQGIITWSGTEQQAGTAVKLGDKKNASIVDTVAGCAFTTVIISAPDVAPGGSYNAVIGSVEEKLTAN